MANVYFNHVNNRIDPGSRALDSQINNIADEIAAGFDLFPTEQELKQNTLGFGVSTGTPNALIVVLSYTPSLLDGFNFSARFNGTNSGAATMNVSATGAKSIVNSDGSPLTSGAMITGTIGQFAYDLPNDRYILISNNSAWGKPVISASTDPSEYCPGYTFTFVSTTAWSIVGLDVTNLFNVGRRLRFIDGVNNYFGTITISAFSGGDTDITMDMDGNSELTASISEVCLVTGTAGWSAIETNPFAGVAINDICFGTISGVAYLFAVGGGGRCGVSSDGGLNWIMLATGTTENLLVCTYDSINEEFWGGGTEGVLVNTANATSTTLDTTSIPTLTSDGSSQIAGLAYSSSEDALIVLYQRSVSIFATASSLTQGTTWFLRATTFGDISQGIQNLKSVVTPGGGTGPVAVSLLLNNTIAKQIDSHNDTTFQSTDSVNGVPSSIIFFDEGGLAVRVYGLFNGRVAGEQSWTGVDDVAFSATVRSGAYSSVHQRLVLVGNDAQIGHWDAVDKLLDDAVTPVENGFNPIADILAVVWDDTHGVFVAVADNGQICRSTNGIN